MRQTVSPGLIAGGGLKRGAGSTSSAPIVRFPRPRGRGRIETPGLRDRLASVGHVSPGLVAGGGLKLHYEAESAGSSVSPGLVAGGGLKHGPCDSVGTDAAVSPGLVAGGGLKLTVDERDATVATTVSPGLIAGGGLKRCRDQMRRRSAAGFPRPHRRGRIETWSGVQVRDAKLVSPGLTAGGGLKPSIATAIRPLRSAFPPASSPGAD